MAGHKKWNRFERSKSTKVEFHPDSSKTIRRETYLIPTPNKGSAPSLKSLEGKNLILSGTGSKSDDAIVKSTEEARSHEVIVDKFGLRWPRNKRYKLTD